MSSALNPAKIAIFTSSEGHLSIAQAIEQILAEKYETVTYYKRDGLMSAYVFLYQFLPFGYRIPYVLTQKKTIADASLEFLKKRYEHDIRRFLRRNKPSLCISTFYMYNTSLATICEEMDIPWINVVTDPRTIHPLILSKDALTNFVYDEDSVKDCELLSPRAHCTKASWFVRKDFQPVKERSVVRQKLELEPNLFTLLLTAGSEGTNYIAKILPALLSSQKPLQIVAMCGNNKNLFRSLMAAKSVVARLNPQVTLTVVGYTNRMAEYVQASDLVVGKAGPNSLFEAAATQTPFFAITHIAGQEDGNLDVIRQYQLGYVEENPFKASTLLTDIINDPGVLEKFNEPLRNVAADLASSRKILLNTVQQILKNHVADSK